MPLRILYWLNHENGIRHHEHGIGFLVKQQGEYVADEVIRRLHFNDGKIHAQRREA